MIVNEVLDNIYERMDDDLDNKTTENVESEIQDYFANKTLFITGVTGFMGKCLVEKLLKSCPGIKHIYVLMRQRKNLPVEQHLPKYFKNVIFDSLRNKCPDFEQKVTAVMGDIAEEQLGLSNENLDIIKKEANIIIHNAANVKFDLKVNISLRINVLGTKRMLDLAQECQNLELFLYVSTAYSYCGYKKDLEEVIYPPPADLKVVHDMIEADLKTEIGLSDDAVKMLIGDHPNIYTFTKAMSEDLINQYGKKSNYAVGIYRPAIVVSAANEPLSGWCGNWNGPVMVILGTGLGLIHAAYHIGYPMDYIPVDYTINALIAVTWDLSNRRKIEQNPVIYNYGSSTTNPVSLPMMYDYIKDEADNERSANAVFFDFVLFIRNKWLFYIMHILLHFLPACLADIVLLLSGNKPRALYIFWRVSRQLDKIDYFGNGNWKIHMPRTIKVLDKLNAVDKELFFCDIRKLDWHRYMLMMWRGMRLYILKERLDSDAGARRYRLIKLGSYSFLIILILILGYYTIN